jgi:hypothetical protein
MVGALLGACVAASLGTGEANASTIGFTLTEPTPVVHLYSDEGAFLGLADAGNGDVVDLAFDASTGRLYALLDGGPPNGEGVYVANGPTFEFVVGGEISEGANITAAGGTLAFTLAESSGIVNLYNDAGEFLGLVDAGNGDVTDLSLDPSTGRLFTLLDGGPPGGEGVYVANGTTFDLLVNGEVLTGANITAVGGAIAFTLTGSSALVNLYDDTGTLLEIVDAGNGDVTDVAFEPSTSRLYALLDGGPTEGEGVYVANGAAFDLLFQSEISFGANITAVPEPSIALLLGLGLAGVAATQRRGAAAKRTT